MKKIIFAVLMLCSVSLFAQYSKTIYLQTGGVPITGKQDSIEFTRYPHSSIATDEVSGITVTETPSSSGVYLCKGFTTYEYVCLWIAGVKQTWFDSVQVGDFGAWLAARYVTLSTNQTISGTKTFGNGNINGDWLQSLGTFTMYGPKINTSATIYSAYGSVNNDHMIWRGFGDSTYGIKHWFFDGTNMRLESGVKWLGRTDITSPVGLNTAHFSYSDNKISLLNPYTTDSLTIKKDTTISESTYYKLWSWKRRFWSQRDSMDMYIHYENTYTNTSDSFAVINKVYYLADVNSQNAVDNADWENIQTLTFPGPGTYAVTVTFEYEFSYITPTNSVYDSLQVGVFNGEPEDDPMERFTYRFAYNNTVPGGFQGTGTLQFVKKIISSNLSDLAFYAKCSKTVTVTLSDNNVYIKRYKIQAIRIN